MRPRCFLIAVAFAFVASPAIAQTYGASPVPRSTSPATMHAQAVQREIIERFHLGLAALDAHRWSDASAEFTRILALALSLSRMPRSSPAVRAAQALRCA